ncbi:Mur ligase family protein [Paenibacillus sacheonensis]|uniref:UDP-N-acetylmuramyl-tripeptide synthetase n=1 Tax=Paenibacillus sacheonensis TaxID=742054 RepID=A0A7X4YRX8_9BACL|nr:UDP-N-acetylmuramoyl-L-alanyl-D-glutamate--2,6-diaminopimelate ligase [Paenibacillus sacheonensis]MBM7567482.1 UDP-N-acetylmuramoyl-L-alanyl-D-glutamate--2,6-diaminopimelate ligase [Paenibacillus sacheonensis]NBC71413.1 UDP-N-acetylmuramyl-tripeptide synthetase [Paenibacillus sacheonensis]
MTTKFQLQQLLQETTVTEAYQAGDIEVTGISYHSQKVLPGELFVCITGYSTDGHRYLGDAVARGAVAAVVERIQPAINVPQYVVPNSRIAMAQLASAFYGHPADRMKMIGITATNGKTSTTYMTNAILEQHGFKTGMIGTVVIKIDEERIPSELTTPESLDLQAYLKQMADRGVTHVSMEVSSAAQETHRVESVGYDIVCFNNLSREHIDSHGTFENYFAAKSRLIREAGENSCAVLNLDDGYAASLVTQTRAKVVTFSMQSREGTLHCKDLDLSTGRAKFTVEILKPIQADGGAVIEPGEFRVELRIPGLHSVYNSMAAIAIALLCGVSVATIQETLRTFGGVERRFEFIHEDAFTIIDDHFANPGNIDVTLETLRYMDYENFHLVYAIRGARGPIINRENAESIVKWLNRLEKRELIATRSQSHVNNHNTVSDEEVDVFLDVMNEAGIEVKLYSELPEAIATALSQAQRGDLILLAGCQGMDPGAEIALGLLANEGSNEG